MIEEKILSIGLRIPIPPLPAGSYIPVVKTGNLIFVSGQIPFIEGSNILPEKYRGKIPSKISIILAEEASKICVINCLAQIKSFLGNLDLIKKIIRLTGYINCEPTFTEHPKVINGASDFLLEVFGELGRHTRVAIGTNSLPLDSVVEIDLICEI